MAMNPRLLRPLATGFNPKSIAGLGGWWDFSDSSTVSLSSSEITSVTDKSGNGRNAAQGTANNRPSIATNVRNGRAAALFDGSNDALDVTWGAQQFTAMTVFAVVHPTGAGGGNAGNIYTRGSQGTSFRRDNANTAFTFLPPWTDATGNASQRTAASSAPLNEWRLVSVRYTGGPSTSADVIPRVNRASSTAGLTGTRVALATNQSTILNIGNREVGNNYDRGWEGHIAELLIYTDNLSTSQVDAVEKYLAAKWGF
jgi:hypothetical protein